MSKESDFVIHKKDSDKSSVWYHYLTAKDGKCAKCKKCGTVLKTLGGSTKGLHTHLSAKHGTKVLKEQHLIPSDFPSTSEERDVDSPCLP